MTRAELVEAMARAICAERGTHPDWPHNGGPGWWTTYSGDATAALAAIEAVGFAVVPREPTNTMFMQGGDVFALDFNAGVLRPLRRVGDYSARAVYRAMIAASPVEARNE